MINFEGHILYSLDPKRLGRMLVSLFDGEILSSSGEDSLVVLVGGMKFFLRENPNSEIPVKIQTNQSFCFHITNTDFVDEFPGRYQFFFYKEAAYGTIHQTPYSVERLQKVDSENLKGFLVVDADGRTWTLLTTKFEYKIPQYNKTQDKILHETCP